ncbi:hypothetical protein ONO57_27025, partial [Salmonella enterica subsp. enterica serovar Anatum]|nr:hypothetical protein [Salmonella enterica subsp. enterica serovar Anatum]
AVYAFFSGGPGILQWLYPNELFPTDIRASAVGVIMSLSRIGTKTNRPAMQRVHRAKWNDKEAQEQRAAEQALRNQQIEEAKKV